jgi:hypothetical protein
MPELLQGPWCSQSHEALDVGRGAPDSSMARIKLLLHLLQEQMLGDWHLLQQAFASRLGNPTTSQYHTRRRLTIQDPSAPKESLAVLTVSSPGLG